MSNWGKARYNLAIFLIFLLMLFNSCAGGQATQNKVVNEYLLTEAGFGKLDVNETTPKRQALFDASVKGQFITYRLDGTKYYVYADEATHNLYLGDEAAYQKYLSNVKDKRLCQSLDATDSSAFWSCYQEFQKGGK